MRQNSNKKKKQFEGQKKAAILAVFLGVQIIEEPFSIAPVVFSEKLAMNTKESHLYSIMLTPN